MFSSQRKEEFQLSMRQEIPVPHGSDTKETVQTNIEETAFEKYDPYVFTVIFMLVNAWQLDFIMLGLNYEQ
jgi:hypothetical protein